MSLDEPVINIIIPEYFERKFACDYNARLSLVRMQYWAPYQSVDGLTLLSPIAPSSCYYRTPKFVTLSYRIYIYRPDKLEFDKTLIGIDFRYWRYMIEAEEFCWNENWIPPESVGIFDSERELAFELLKWVI